jgi:hypothetical protein
MLARRGDVSGPVRARRQPTAGMVFGSCFGVLLALLLVRNTGVFTLHVAERGDWAANSIIVEQAKHFDLLVGNYSRVGFSHPGPAYFYVCALGEWLGYDVLGVLPSPYNGQWLATLVLNAALVAAALTVLWTWARSWRALLWYAAVTLAFVALHDQVFSSTWMPFVYIAPFLLFLTASASVAAGRTAHLWLFTLSGGLLVHGHAEFLLLFVPAIAVASLAVLLYGRRRRAGDPFVVWHWLAGAGVVAAFLLPMVLNLGLHWPGEFHKYLTYGNHHTSTHSLAADLRYTAFFWFPQPVIGLVLVLAGFAAAVVMARRQPDPHLRRFLITGLGVVVLAGLLFLGYIVKGIDQLQSYIGYFFWAAPLLFLLLLATAAEAWWRHRQTTRIAKRVATALPIAAAAAALAFAAVAPAVPSRPEGLPQVTGVIRALASYSAGRPAVLTLDHDAWPQMTALLLAGERTGQRVCVRDRSWKFMVTDQLVCTRQDLADGVPVAMTERPGEHLVNVTFGGTTMTMTADPT